MTTKLRSLAGYVCAVITIAALHSCKKESSGTASAATSSDYITIASNDSTAGTDSVQVVQPCGLGYQRDSLAESALPASVTAYLDSSYSGYAFGKAFTIVSSTGSNAGYVVIIYYNGKPVALQFDADGNLEKVLKLRDGPGGGRQHFPHRDGHLQDSVSLSDLPAAITSYFSASYSSDTLLRAYTTHDGSYVVLSKNNSLLATVFTSSGVYVKRVQLSHERASFESVEQSALPASAQDYLSETYPDYVFEKAYAASDSRGIVGMRCISMLTTRNTW